MTRLGETLRAYQARDPAARSRLEIFLLYPGVHAIIFHRVSHWLWTHHLCFLARLNSQISQRWEKSQIPRSASGLRYFFSKIMVPVNSGTSPLCRGMPNFSGKSVRIRAMISISISTS